jgi:hypothetical protein
MKVFLAIILIISINKVKAQSGDPYSTRNPNASQDWISSQQSYSQSVINSYRSTSSGVGISINGGSASYMWEKKGEAEKARQAARQAYCEKNPDVCEFSRKRDSATAVENARIAKAFADRNYMSEQKCKQQKKEQEFLENVGFKNNEITLFIDRNYLPDGFTPNRVEYDKAKSAYEFLKNNMKSAGFESLIYNLYYLTHHGFHHSSYEFFDELSKQFADKKDELEQFNLYLCQQVFYFSLKVRYDLSLSNINRSWAIYYNERAVWEFYQYTVKYPSLAYDNFAFFHKNKNDNSIEPFEKLYTSLLNDKGSLRGFKRYVKDMDERKILGEAVRAKFSEIFSRFKEDFGYNPYIQ